MARATDGPNDTIVPKQGMARLEGRRSVTNARPEVLILGTRGIPAAHGGFETFAERLAIYLAGRGWRVGVYCQREVERVGTRVVTSDWNGIALITVEVGL